jgi:hypothetical protein
MPAGFRARMRPGRDFPRHRPPRLPKWQVGSSGQCVSAPSKWHYNGFPVYAYRYEPIFDHRVGEEAPKAPAPACSRDCHYGNWVRSATQSSPGGGIECIDFPDRTAHPLRPKPRAVRDNRRRHRGHGEQREEPEAPFRPGRIRPRHAPFRPPEQSSPSPHSDHDNSRIDTIASIRVFLAILISDRLRTRGDLSILPHRILGMSHLRPSVTATFRVQKNRAVSSLLPRIEAGFVSKHGKAGCSSRGANMRIMAIGRCQWASKPGELPSFRGDTRAKVGRNGYFPGHVRSALFAGSVSDSTKTLPGSGWLNASC